MFACFSFTAHTPFPQELVSYGLSEELLQTTFRQVSAGEPASWQLMSIPNVGFYQSLHHFLKRWPLTRRASKRAVAEFYIAIDPKLSAKGSRPDSIYRFIEGLSNVHPDQAVYYGTQQRKVKQLQSDIEHCNHRLDEMTLEYMELKEQFLESKSKLQRTKKSLQDITNQRDTMKRSRDFTKSKLSRSEEKFKSLEAEKAQLLLENLDLEDTLSDLADMESSEDNLQSFCAKRGKAYPPLVRKLYYSLLAKQVPASQCSEIVKTVLETFYPTVDVQNLPLPQKSCASYMRKEELVTVSSAHKASVLCEAAKTSSGFRLNTDGTTKNQKKLGGIVINDTILSVNELSDGTALTAVDDISKELEKLRTTAKLLGLPNANSINWTMLVSSTSDSASTQKRLNKLIQERREEDEKRFGAATTDTVELIETFCAMHLGVNLRKAFLSGLDSDDVAASSRKYNSVDQFVHEFCKLFSPHGAPEYACGAQAFPDFLALMSQSDTTNSAEYYRGCMDVTLDRQVGSRYFVSASNAAKLIHLKDAATHYLTYTGKNEAGNKLEQDVFAKLHDPMELAAVRADAIMFYHCYADLVMLSKSNDLGKSALDMGTHYLELKVFLCEVKDDVQVALSKDQHVFVSEERLYGKDKKCNHRLHKGMSAVVNSLFDVPENEEPSLKVLLKSGASTMLDKLCGYAASQLPGGIYWEPQDSIRKVLSQLQPSNDICESVLGLNDYLTTALPNLDQVSRSTLVQVKKNKTLKWLGTLPLQQQNSILNLAVKRRKEVSESSKEEAKQRAERRRQNLTQAHTRREAQKEKRLAEREELVQHHLIASSEELLEALSQIDAADLSEGKKRSEKVRLLKTQINIRKKVLNQNIRIVFSRSRQQRPINEIIHELSDFIKENTPFTEILQNPESIIGSRVSHLFVINGKEEWYKGTIVGYNSSENAHEIAYDGEDDHCFFDLSIDIVNGDIKIDL